MKHKARAAELAFDQPIDFRLIREETTDWDRVQAEREQADKDKAENDSKQMEMHNGHQRSDKD